MMKSARMTDEEQRLTIKAPAPDWFHWAVGQPGQSARVTVDGCSIHYLLWQAEEGVIPVVSTADSYGGFS
jgi:hypothetical protein